MDLQEFDIEKRGAYGWKYDRINFSTIYVQQGGCYFTKFEAAKCRSGQ